MVPIFWATLYTTLGHTCYYRKRTVTIYDDFSLTKRCTSVRPHSRESRRHTYDDSSSAVRRIRAPLRHSAQHACLQAQVSK